MVNNKNKREKKEKNPADKKKEEESEQKENQEQESEQIEEEINLDQEQFTENLIEDTDFKLEDLILESGETLPSLPPIPETEDRNLEESLENAPAGERTEEPYTPNIQDYQENILYENTEEETRQPIESRIIRPTLTEEDIIHRGAFDINPHRPTPEMIHTSEQDFHHEEEDIFDYKIKPKEEKREMPWETKSEVFKKYKPGK